MNNNFNLDLSGDCYYSNYPKLYDFCYQNAYSYYERQKKDIIRCIPDEKEISSIDLLDVGCGTGRLLSQFNSTEGVIMGLDKSGDMLRIARENTDNPLMRGDINSFCLNFEFDCISAFGSVIGHFETKEQTITSIKNIVNHLSENGVFIFTTYDKNGIAEGDIHQSTINNGDKKVIRKTKIHSVSSEKCSIKFTNDIYNSGTFINSIETTLDLLIYTKKELKDYLKEGGIDKYTILRDGEKRSSGVTRMAGLSK